MKTLTELAELLGLDAPGDRGETLIHVVAGSVTAGPDALVFAEDGDSLSVALASQAAAVVTTPALAAQVAGQKPVIQAKQPRLQFARAARLLRDANPAAGVHPTATVGEGAKLGEEVSIGPGAVVGNGASIGARSSIGAGAVIGEGVVLGCDCQIYPRVVIYPATTIGDRVVLHAGAVLGADGFGYVRNAENGEYLQFPQQGTLVLEDDVEVGANSTIDRGALEDTRIGRGTKIDNLVHIGHNCKIGRNVVIASMVGISGSSAVGDGAVLAGQVGIGDHASVGEGVILGGQAGVLPHKNLRGAGMLFWGTPAKPVKQYLRELATLARQARKRKD